ncbi:MAG: hypothetical protein ACRYHC_10810 [Janthinobacterium lividum]
MSTIAQPATPHDMREARQLARHTRALLAGKAPADPVLRFTVDWMSEKARRPRMNGSGGFEDECDSQDAMLATIDRMQVDSVLAGPRRYRGDHSPAGVRIAQEIAKDMKKNRNGCSDLSYSQMRDAAGLRHADTAMDRFHDLVESGAVDYVRRSAPTGAAKQWGVPQRMQISGRCFFTPDRLPDRYRKFYQDELARRREKRGQAIRRALARSNLDRAVADRQAAAHSGGTPAKRLSKPPRLFDPWKVNPAGMQRAHDAQATAVASSDAAEADTAAFVAANLDALKAQMLAQCG